MKEKWVCNDCATDFHWESDREDDPHCTRCEGSNIEFISSIQTALESDLSCVDQLKNAAKNALNSEEKTYEFTVHLIGSGTDPDSAWKNACEALEVDGPGETPENYEEYPDDD